MAQETNQSQAPLLCTTGCGFYGNPRNNGMCSVCYKDFLQRQNSSGRVSPPVLSAATSSLGESLLAARRSESSTVDVPSGAESGPASVSSPALLTPASIRSAEERPAAEKDGLKTDVPAAPRSAATAVVSVSASVSAASPEAAAAVAGQSRQPGKRSSGEDFLPDGSPEGKRRPEDEDERPTGGQASSSVSAEGSVEGQDTPAEDTPSDTPSDKPNAKKNRCFTCRKKVGLTGFDCRCGRVFCGVHRYSDVHRCTFDYKADAAEKIRKENPVIVGEKIQKI